jgi:hypothetical protein
VIAVLSTRPFGGGQGGDDAFHHGRVFVRLGRFADQGDINFAPNERHGQGLKKSLGGFQMLALAFKAVLDAGKMGVKFFRQFF